MAKKYHGEGEKPASALPEMPDGDEADASATLQQTLQKAVAAVDSQEKADAVIDELVQAPAQQQPIGTITDHEPTQSAAQAAAQVAAVDEATDGETPPEQILEESARAVATTEGQDQAEIGDAVQAVFNPEEQLNDEPEQAVRRLYLRRALLKRMAPLDAIDAKLFLWVNGLPRAKVLNRFFYFLTLIYRGGAAWYALLLLILTWRPRLGKHLLREIALPLGLAIWLVEYPIKAYFRRHRPFITIVQAIVIGRKPQSWSFPSGHAATAYAGAWLFSRYLPRWRGPLYLVATLTAFSRVYLGAHYPGDIVAGSTLGVLFAWLLRRVPWPWRSTRR